MNLIGNKLIDRQGNIYTVIDQNESNITLNNDKKYGYEIIFKNGIFKAQDEEIQNAIMKEFEEEKTEYIPPKKTRSFDPSNDEFKYTKYVDGIPTRVVVFNIGYMENYCGEEDESLQTGGKFVQENGTGGEINNFNKMDDGYTYGFVETMYDSGHTADVAHARKLHIEHIDSAARNKEYLCGVLVVFIANSPYESGNIVVGWYDNATVYRRRIEKSHMRFGCNVKCLNQDSHLIPENEREFIIHKVGPNGEYRFGQSYQWYIGEKPIHRELLKDLVEYINSKREEYKDK